MQGGLYEAVAGVCEGADMAHVPVRLCAPLYAACRLGAYKGDGVCGATVYRWLYGAVVTWCTDGCV